MAVGSFKDEEVEIFFVSGKAPRKRGWAVISNVVKRKLDMLHYAKDLKDLKSPPSNCLESLTGDLLGFYSIRINDQWRIIFRWDSRPFDIKIADYH